MAKIFIVGGAGFIGSHICRELINSGEHEVIVYDAFIQYMSPFENDYNYILKKRFEGIKDSIIFERGDASNQNEFHRLLLRYHPERIIQLASMPLSTLSNIHIEEAVNSTLLSTARMLEIIAREKFVERFLYTSSSMIYGDFKYIPADEEHPKNPKDVYAGSKLAGEYITSSFCKRFGIDYTIIRPSAVYGPTDMNKRVSQIFVENAVMGKELIVEGDQNNRLDFTHVTDAAKGFVLALFSEKASGEIFNITRGEGRSLFEFANIVAKHISNVKIVERPVDNTRPLRGELDISKAKRLLGYEPKISLEEGISDYLNYFYQIEDKYKNILKINI